jgi:capsular polysaccharide biosynthesis protein
VHGTPDFDVIEFVDYLRDKWSVFLVSCGVAVALAVTVSLAMPKSYTGKATVVIDPPVGADPRAILALNSIYLDSLKTYESFAASDTLFQQAMARVGAAGSKASVLRVSMPANTMVIEIRATLRDPRKAQALAQYIAEQTVAGSNSADTKTPEDAIAVLRSKQQEAMERLGEAKRARDAAVASAPIAALEDDLRGGFDQKFRFEGDLSRARIELAEHGTRPDDAIRARIASIEKQERELAAELEQKGARLDASRSRRDAMEAEVRAAQTAWEDATSRSNNALTSNHGRAQRLRVIDPGTVPQQPASPNLWLNTASALFASLIGAFGFLMLRFGYVRLQRERSERVYSLV